MWDCFLFGLLYAPANDQIHEKKMARYGNGKTPTVSLLLWCVFLYRFGYLIWFSIALIPSNIYSYFLLVKLSPSWAFGVEYVLCAEAVWDRGVLWSPGVPWNHRLGSYFPYVTPTHGCNICYCSFCFLKAHSGEFHSESKHEKQVHGLAYQAELRLRVGRPVGNLKSQKEYNGLCLMPTTFLSLLPPGKGKWVTPYTEYRACSSRSFMTTLLGL